MFPEGVAVDSSGNIYVADAFGDTIRKIVWTGSDWNVSTLAGLVSVAGYSDGTGSGARFNMPAGVAVDAAGNVYVGDSDANNIAKGNAAFQFDASKGNLVVTNGNFQMKMTGPPSGTVYLYTSSNLTHWTAIQTNSLSAGAVILSVPLNGDPHRYYRAQYVP
jgi:hypothetical protein